MNEKIVWIFGSSASGKETLIQKLVNSADSKLLKNFGFVGYKVTDLRESRKWIMQFSDDPVAENRKQFPSLIKKLIKPNTVILIKGQEVDLEYKTPSKILELYPNIKHEIIFLSLPIDEIYKRCRSKPWWEEGIDTKEDLLEWLSGQIKELSLLTGFTISAFDSSSEDYRKTLFPPKLDL